MTARENRRLRLSLNSWSCHFTTFVILFLAKVISVGQVIDTKNNTKKISEKDLEGEIL